MKVHWHGLKYEVEFCCDSYSHSLKVDTVKQRILLKGKDEHFYNTYYVGDSLPCGHKLEFVKMRNIGAYKYKKSRRYRKELA